MNRRSLLLGLGLSSVAYSFRPRGVRAEEESGENEVEYLFVQNAGNVVLADGMLTMKGINPATLYFSDRPERIVGHVSAEEFIGLWDDGDDSFKDDPPNAALSVVVGSAPRLSVVVLRNPRLHGNELAYDVEVLDGEASARGGPASLFIDTFGRPLSPGSAAGVHRRHRRRRRRRVVY